MQSHTDFYLIYVTVADAYGPLRLARMCVEGQLAACGYAINALGSGGRALFGRLRRLSRCF